ncbi:MAG: lysophospholipid acyltransferase family protein [Pseudomonadota bacterium]
MRWLRSILFSAQIYVMMLLMAIVFIPFALASRDWAVYACRTWCRWVVWTASWMVGVKVDIRGTPPTSPVLIAAKHQSFFDIILIFMSIPKGRFIMKQQLKFAPILGQFALRIGCIPVDRGKRGQAVADMVGRAIKDAAYPGQLIIYPQGTRVPPGEVRPYKVGAAALYEALGQTCVPVATNVGLFWPKFGTLNPGTAVVEFLDTLPPGLDRERFLSLIEERIETRSNALIDEARR